ncbi:extensin family protein [Sphingomonas sp. GCM10030256]|uniref:extensin-like domain-containing protein n=1 Tax=Sphingomonas sp. GCM10030256 TaxID=3273427 RepID=UPI00361689A1
MRRAILWLIVLAAAAVALIEARSWMDRHPQDLPWTALSLDDPLGRFTASKLARLGKAPAQCRLLLAEGGTLDVPAPARISSNRCGYRDGIRLRGDNARLAGFAPAELITSCPTAAALLLWDKRVLQPAAQRHFGTGVEQVLHAGSFSCRRLYGRASGPWSEHATADAVDIVGFRLGNDRTVSVLRDWSAGGSGAAFLRDVRDGACAMFSTVLSPDYNAAHRDHLHLDMADRGAAGWKACR